MTKILLTGFEPFDDVKVNPSQLIVEHFKKQKNTDLITEVLPVAYWEAQTRIRQLLTKNLPDAVLMLGVAQKREKICLERIAININDASIADNRGTQYSGEHILRDAPVGYWSTLPLEAMCARLEKVEIPVTFSNHAGAFLCNHIFYIARHTLESYGRTSVPCGFIHLPSLETLPLDTQIQAIEYCLETLKGELAHQARTKHYSEILKQAMERLSPKPRQAAIVTIDGKILTSCSLLVDKARARTSLLIEADRLAAMSAAASSLDERISSELHNGDFRETIIYGSTGIFILTHLNEQAVFGTIFEAIPSLDSIRKQLHELNNGLNKLVAAIN